MPASRPSARRICQASGRAASSWASSSLTAIRIAWKVRLAGWPPAKRAGVGIAFVIASTSSKVVSSGRERSICAGDPVGVALLAVLAQGAREAAAVPRVDDLARGQLLARVHPHVQRGVVGVGEAALERVDLHRGHPEVEVDEVGDDALLGELPQAVLEVGADEAGRARHLGGQLGERLLRERVAVDRDQRAGRADPVRDEAGVAGRAEGAVDGDLARLGVQRLDELPGEDGDVRAGHVKQDGQEMR